jgi:hypothetical protein
MIDDFLGGGGTLFARFYNFASFLIIFIIINENKTSDIWHCNILTYYLGNILAYYLDN